MVEEFEEVLNSNSIPINNRTGYDTFMVILPSFFFTFLIVFLETMFQLDKRSRFIFEMFTIIFPLILGMTILSDHPRVIVCVLFLASIFVLMFVSKKNVKSKKSITFETNFITNTRSTVNTLSVIAILAVDFHIFPSRFTKMDTLGYSLMDTGVGLYVFSNGIVSPESRGIRNPITKSIKSALPLFLIGSARFVLTKLFHYHVPVAEYGVHWNFFITLSITKLFTSFILVVFSIKNVYINAIMLLLAHQMLLVLGLQRFVFDDFERDNFIKANKEGIVSSLGFVVLYLFSVYFGYILDIKNKEQYVWKVLKKITVVTLLCLFMSVAFQQFFGISRRLANAAYIFWILFIGTFMTGLFYCLQVMQMIVFPVKQTIFAPYIYEAANYNGLVFFLVANVMTGVVNMSINTSEVDHYASLLINIVYMFLNCAVVGILYSKEIRIKL